MLHSTLYFPKSCSSRAYSMNFRCRLEVCSVGELLVLGTTGDGKNVVVDGGVVESADAAIVHTNLAEVQIIE